MNNICSSTITDICNKLNNEKDLGEIKTYSGQSGGVKLDSWVKNKINSYSLTNDFKIDTSRLKSRSKSISNDIDCYDILLKNDLYSIPIGIKLCVGNSACNVGSKNGVIFSIFGIIPELSSQASYLEVREVFKSNKDTVNKYDSDFCFIIFTGKSFIWKNLRSCDLIIPNGNNLPFQIPFLKQANSSGRSNDESVTYIKTKWLDSLSQAALKKEIMEEFLK